MLDKKNEEYWENERALQWYKRQFEEPYRITVAFRKFIEKNINISSLKGLNVLDLGCGAGEVTSYFAEIYPDIYFTGIDANESLFKYCMKHPANMKLEKGDWFDLSAKYYDNSGGGIEFTDFILAAGV